MDPIAGDLCLDPKSATCLSGFISLTLLSLLRGDGKAPLPTSVPRPPACHGAKLLHWTPPRANDSTSCYSLLLFSQDILTLGTRKES